MAKSTLGFISVQKENKLQHREEQTRGRVAICMQEGHTFEQTCRNRKALQTNTSCWQMSSHFQDILPLYRGKYLQPSKSMKHAPGHPIYPYEVTTSCPVTQFSKVCISTQHIPKKQSRASSGYQLTLGKHG